MKKLSITILALAVVGLAACDAVRPLPSPDEVERVIEVAVFEGGYGIEWHQTIAERFNEERKADNIRVELWGDPRTADIIKPRLLRGDPPDLILDERLPLWLLIAADKLLPFEEELAIAPVGTDRAWGSLFANGMLDTFRSGDRVYAVPAAAGVWACWYDARLFREHGWTPPATWAEFLTLCEAIKQEGIAPVTLQGKYVSFYAWNTYVSLIHRVGGLAAINRINALQSGAFSHPDVVHAAALFQQLARDFLQPGALAMTHTESQLQFVKSQAAMIFCGIWLENEMKGSTPPGFELRAFKIPRVEGGRGNPALLHAQGMEYLFVPADARYPELAFEFARYLVSPANAPDMAENIGVISPLEGATPRDAVSPALRSVLDIMEASPAIYNVRVRSLLPEWTAQTMITAMAALLRDEVTPAEFCRIMDQGLSTALEKPDLVIPPHRPYNLAANGEA